MRFLMVFCAKRALKYEQMKDMLLAQDDSINYIYSVGTVVLERNKWLKRLLWLQNICKK